MCCGGYLLAGAGVKRSKPARASRKVPSQRGKDTVAAPQRASSARAAKQHAKALLALNALDSALGESDDEDVEEPLHYAAPAKRRKVQG